MPCAAAVQCCATALQKRSAPLALLQPADLLFSRVQINVGRVAMVGIAGTLLTEAIIGHAVL